MATFKCDVKQQFGKFHGYAWKVGDPQGNPVCKDEATANAAVDKVVGALRTGGFDRGDEVIFRDTAYATLQELQGVMQRSRY